MTRDGPLEFRDGAPVAAGERLAAFVRRPQSSATPSVLASSALLAGLSHSRAP